MNETYTVTARITVRLTDPEAVHRLAAAAGAGGSDDQAQLEAAAQAGLRELPGLVRPYGFEIVDSEAHVEEQA